MSDAFARAVRGLLDNATKHIEMGHKARAWAEEAFDIAAIGNRVGAAEARMIERPSPGSKLNVNKIEVAPCQKNSSN
jgi:hypothetical protein